MHCTGNQWHNHDDNDEHITQHTKDGTARTAREWKRARKGNKVINQSRRFNLLLHRRHNNVRMQDGIELMGHNEPNGAINRNNTLGKIWVDACYFDCLRMLTSANMRFPFGFHSNSIITLASSASWLRHWPTQSHQCLIALVWFIYAFDQLICTKQTNHQSISIVKTKTIYFASTRAKRKRVSESSHLRQANVWYRLIF